SKPTQSLVITGLNHYFISAIYPLSIYTRITRENCAKNNRNFNPQNKHPERLTPTISTHPITKTGDKNKTQSYRWMASLRETIHPA
ncbi:hypothetical protein, partial [Salmonella enterica]|uniref:hypothetical protein n=1 Tax=Salmonella enterica TaxID=28901 RepID=UPI001CB8365A